MKNIINISILSLFCFFALLSCNDEEKKTDEKAYLKIVESQLNFTARGGEGKIVVDQVVTLKGAVSSDSWCKVNISGNQANVILDPNGGLLGRTALITLTTADDNTIRVPVTQTGNSFGVSETLFETRARYAEFEVNVRSLLDVVITRDSEWLNFILEGEKMTIKVDANNGENPRVGKIIVVSGDLSATISVNQNAPTFYNEIYNIEGRETTMTYEVEGIIDDFEIDVDWIDLKIDGYMLTFDVEYNSDSDPRTGIIKLSCGTQSSTITFNQEKRPFYDDLLGDYTMHYSTSNNSPPTRNRTLPVKLVQAVQDETYYLTGILDDADEALGKIVVNYRPDREVIEILGQTLYVRAGNPAQDLRWFPRGITEGTSIPIPGYAASFTAGVISTVDIVDGKINLTMETNGINWSTANPPASNTIPVGFALRFYNTGTTTTAVAVNGKDGQPFYNYLLFIKD